MWSGVSSTIEKHFGFRVSHRFKISFNTYQLHEFESHRNELSLLCSWEDLQKQIHLRNLAQSWNQWILIALYLSSSPLEKKIAFDLLTQGRNRWWAGWGITGKTRGLIACNAASREQVTHWEGLKQAETHYPEKPRNHSNSKNSNVYRLIGFAK